MVEVTKIVNHAMAARKYLRAPVVLGAVALSGATTALWLFLGSSGRHRRRRQVCEDRGHDPEAHVGVLRPFYRLHRERLRMAEEANCRYLPDILEAGTTNRHDTKADRLEEEAVKDL